MAKKLYEESSIQAIADAIRAKNGTTGTYKVGEMAGAVRSIEGLKTSVTEYSQLNDTAAAYLAAAEAAYTDTNGDAVSVIADYVTNSGNKDWPQGLILPTQPGTRYVLDEADGTGGSIANQVGSSSVIYNTVPGHPVQYFVKDSSGGVVSSGRVKSTGQLRMLRFSGYVKNCRDLGGWACDGGTVRYGLLYRCAAPGASLESIDRYYAELANIRYQIDVRDSTAFTASPFGSRVYYRFRPMMKGYVDAVKQDGVDYIMTKAVLLDIFDAVAHGDGSIFHCSLGRDRTGTIAFLLLALLGVSRRHIDMDYELSGFSSVSDSSALKRTNSAYLGLANYIMNQGKTTLRDNAVMWAVKAGFTVDEINAFRAAAIDGTPPVLAAGDYQIAYTLTQNLTNCTSSVTATTVYENAALSITLTPGSGYKLDSILVTMAGVDITATAVSDAAIHISNVTGNVIITAVATALYPNQIPISTDTSGAVFNGVGYQQGYRLNSSGSPASLASAFITGFIPVHSGDTVRFEGMGLKEGSSAINELRIAFYDTSKTVIAAPYWKDTGTNTISDGYLVSLTVPTYSGKTVAFARFGCYWIDSNSVITVHKAAAAQYTNVIPLSINADGTPFNNGKGWKHGYLIQAGAGNEVTNSSWNVTGYIPVTWNDTFRVKNYGFSTSTTAYDNICFYDSSFAFVGPFTNASLANPLSQFITDGMIVAQIASATKTNFSDEKKQRIAYMRLSFDDITDNTIVTINEEIV